MEQLAGYDRRRRGQEAFPDRPDSTPAAQAVFLRQQREDEQKTIAAALRIEERLQAALAPLEGREAPLGLRHREQSLRLAIVWALGPDIARELRKQAAAPKKPLLVCQGNPLFGPPQFDEHGPKGCGRVFRGQWRVVNRGERQAALGPRCRSCNRRITEDLRLQRRRRSEVYADTEGRGESIT